MALPLPEGSNILVAYRKFDGNFSMPTMEMASDHYNIGFVISGARRTITPMQSYSYQGGDVSLMPPFLFHRTISESKEPYESYLIKFTPDFIQPLIKQMNENIIEHLYNQKVCHFTPQSREKVCQLFREMHEEYTKQKPYTEFILQGMLFRLFTTIWEEQLPDNATTYHHSTLTEPIVDALYYMESNYNQDITLESVAVQVHLSTAYFSRLFKAQLGKSFSEYLTDIRMRHAQALLTQSNKSIMDIALETGYCNGDYLSALFKKKIGMTPSEYRKNAQIKTGK